MAARKEMVEVDRLGDGRFEFTAEGNVTTKCEANLDPPNE